MAVQGISIPQEKLSPQEAFFLKRMTEFWKDRDFGFVKAQVQDFLEKYPDSAIQNNLQAILADILYQEQEYQAALSLYEKINNKPLQQKTLSRKCQCLYLLGHYDSVIAILTPALENPIEYKEEMQFLLADSLFRKLKSIQNLTEQNDLALRAKPLLQALYKTTHQEKVIMPLAEIHRMLGENKEASEYYITLAEIIGDKKEDVLFQAAALQIDFNSHRAIETFQQVVNLGQNRAPDAAYNELVLLFQEDRFSDLISRAPVLQKHLTPQHQPLFNFCLGRSHFKLEQFADAIEYFNRCVEQETESTSYKRAAYLTLVHCAQKTENSLLLDSIVQQFITEFPHDEEAGKALLLHAQLALQSGQIDQAAFDIHKLLTTFPRISDKETLLYDLALLLSKNERWKESREAFFDYLEEFPNTSHLMTWSSIVHCSVQELKSAPPEKVLEKKSQLVNDLRQALGAPNLFSPEEVAHYRFLLGQLLFDLRNYSEALQELTTFTQENFNHPQIPQAVLLQAHLHRELKSPLNVFIDMAEKALSLVSDRENRNVLHLQLFNAYLTLKEHDKAAEHLYQSHRLDETPLQAENELWLAHYYLNQATAGDAEATQRAHFLFQKILKIDDTGAVHFDPQQTYLEGEVLKYAEILSLNEKKQLLVSLLSLQNTHADIDWKLKRQTLFETGKTCLSLNEQENALKIFDDLITSSSLTPSYYSNAALLEKSRMILARCEKKTETTVGSVLSTLKDLQIQKKLTCEPLHLEAALEYADIRTEMAPQESRIESAIFFLNRIKDDFSAKDEAIGQEYHEARLRFPEKDHLYQSYMKCIEAEIFSLESKLALNGNNLAKATECRLLALALLEEVLQDKQITPYLRNRAENKLKSLD